MNLDAVKDEADFNEHADKISPKLQFNTQGIWITNDISSRKYTFKICNMINFKVVRSGFL